ncbi:MAG: hypothetical protein IM674_09300 [Brevundimonas sp.]|nr:hypothetical protein [Brevundimonas sp.]
MIAEGLSAAASVLDIVSSVSKMAQSKDQGDRAEAAEIVEALRSIYFVPRGTLDIIQAVAEGAPFDPGEAKKAFENFEHADRKVFLAIEKLDFERLAKKKEVFSLRASRELELIGWKKIQLRQKVRAFLLNVFDQKADQADAARLHQSLTDLNTKIEELEESLQRSTR